MKKLSYNFQIYFFILIAIVLNIFYPPYLFSSSIVFIFLLPIVLTVYYYNINNALFLLFVSNGLYFPLIGRIHDFSFSGELGKVIVPIIYFNLVAYLFIHLVNNLKQENILNNFTLEAEKAFLIAPYRKEEFIFLFLKLMQKHFNIENLLFYLNDNLQVSFYWEKENTKTLNDWIKNSKFTCGNVIKLYINKEKYFLIHNDKEFNFLIFRTNELLNLETLKKVSIIFENYLKTYSLYLKTQQDKDKFKDVINSIPVGLIAIKNNVIISYNNLVPEKFLKDSAITDKVEIAGNGVDIHSIFLPEHKINFYLIQNQKDKLYLKELLEFEKNFNFISLQLVKDILKTLYLVRNFWEKFLNTNDSQVLLLSKKEMKYLILQTENLLDLCKIAAGRQLFTLKKQISFKNLSYEISFLFNSKFYKLNHFKTNKILNIDIEKLCQILQIMNYVFQGFSINYFNLNEDNLIIKIRFNNSLNYEYFNLGINTANIYNLKNHLSLQGFLGISLINTLRIKFILNVEELYLTIPI